MHLRFACRPLSAQLSTMVDTSRLLSAALLQDVPLLWEGLEQAQVQVQRVRSVLCRSVAANDLDACPVFILAYVAG